MKPTADALLELARVLCSKQDVTSEEVNVLQSCRSNAMREFYAGALVGGGLMWAGGWRFSNLIRITLSGAAAANAGSWRYGRSIDSSVNKILAVDGSRIQRELANLIMKWHWNDPSMMQLITRLFYGEKVFDDSTSDQPRLRWRYTNFFSDVAFHQSSHDSGSHDSSHSNAQRDFVSTSKNNSCIVSHNDSDGRKNDLEHKQVNMNTGPDVMEDPLDCVFGSMTSMEEIHNPSSSSTPTRHDRKRSHHRRRRLHRHELHPEQHHARNNSGLKLYTHDTELTTLLMKAEHQVLDV